MEGIEELLKFIVIVAFFAAFGQYVNADFIDEEVYRTGMSYKRAWVETFGCLFVGLAIIIFAISWFCVKVLGIQL